MALPRDRDARDYYRSAFQWLDDASFLLTAARPRAAVYLAGYTVECLLKALVLDSLPNRKRAELAQSKVLFTHDLDELRATYLTSGGPSLPKDVAKDLLEVGSWDPARRYRPGSVRYDEAERFLKAVQRIAAWADGRL